MWFDLRPIRRGAAADRGEDRQGAFRTPVPGTWSFQEFQYSVRDQRTSVARTSRAGSALRQPCSGSDRSRSEKHEKLASPTAVHISWAAVGKAWRRAADRYAAAHDIIREPYRMATSARKAKGCCRGAVIPTSLTALDNAVTTYF